MINVDLRAVSKDVADRLAPRVNGVKLRVLDDKTYASDVTVYVYVDVMDGGGKNSLEILNLFESVEKETSKRFNVDVLVVPEPPEYV